MNRRTAAGIAAIVLGVVAIWFVGFSDSGRRLYASLAAEFPTAWSTIQPGMTSEQARTILGPPWADGRDLKIVDRWRIVRHGVELHLDVYFERENYADTPIERVVRWKQFMAYQSENYVNPPWPNEWRTSGSR